MRKKRAHQKISVQNVIETVLLGRRHMRAMVMPLRSCSYTVMLTSLRESFMGGEERKMAKSRREKQTTDKSQHEENITAICFIFLSTKIFSVIFIIMFYSARLHHKRKRG